MALRAIRKTDRVRLVHTLDDAVTLPPGEWFDGWISAETPGITVGEGATVATVRPLDAVEVVEAGSYDPAAPPTKSRNLECVNLARLGTVEVAGLASVDELPYQCVIGLGTAIYHLSLGIDDPFGLTARPSESDGDSSEPGSGETPSASTA